MELARFVTGEHDPDCTGCPACNEECAAMLDANIRRYAQADGTLDGYYVPVINLRMKVPAIPYYPYAHVSPDVEALAIPALLSRIPFTEAPDDVPPAPDSYALAIEKRRNR
jgi:hypothetical protein